MLKFFRKYILNKFVLVVVGVVLMVVFLIQGTIDQLISSGASDQGETRVGAVDDSRLRQAEGSLALLRSMGVLQLMSASLVRGEQSDALNWVLMLDAAELAGVSASQAEAAALLGAAGMSQDSLNTLAASARVPPETIYETARQLATLMTYDELVRGVVHQPTPDRVQAFVQGLQLMQRQQPNLAMIFLANAQGSPRVSEPLLASFVQEGGAFVSGRLAVVRASIDTAGDEPVDPATLDELFETYRGDLRGAGQPYGFGYRRPNQVKVSYLEFSVADAETLVTIDEAAALEWYDENKGQLTIPEGQDEPPSYAELRGEIIARLRVDAARDLADRAAKLAQARIQQEFRGVPQSADGYLDLPDGHSPMPLEVVAQQVAEETGLDPVVTHLTEVWTPVSELPRLAGVGLSFLPGRNAAFQTYVMSARAFDDEAIARAPVESRQRERVPLLRPLKLQPGVPSQTLTDQRGNRFIFRLADAQATRIPESVAEVADAVERDALLLRSYKRLVETLPEIAQLAQQRGLEAVANRYDGLALPFGRTPRREPDPRTGRLIPPIVPGVGRSEALISDMFTTAEDAAVNGSLAAASPAQRTSAAAVPESLAVVAYQIGQYLPVTRTTFAGAMSQDFLPSQVALVLLRPDDVEQMRRDAELALQRRVGWVSSAAGSPDVEAPEASSPGGADPPAGGDGSADG